MCEKPLPGSSRPSARSKRRFEHVRDALAKVETEIEHLTAAVAAGGDLPSILAALKDRERQREEFRRRLRDAERAVAAGRAAQSLEEVVRARLADWTGLLQRQVPQARQILKKLLRGSLLFAPKIEEDEGFFEFQGDVSLERILAGIAQSSKVARPAGLEPATSWFVARRSIQLS